MTDKTKGTLLMAAWLTTLGAACVALGWWATR